jgi:NAD(P)-dependent dehydrogenase (short-subunit alcohol dehydrogenase family)
MKLHGKVAVITGAASGMGAAAARLFVSEGAQVVVADVDEEGGRAVAAELGDAGLFVRTDVSDSEQVQALVRMAVKRFGRLTTLYNNAAPLGLVNEEDRSVTELPEEVFDRMWAVVTRGTFLVCKYGIPELIRAGGGSVINTSTVDAVVGQGGYDAYSAAKGGVLSLTRAMAVGFAEHGVRVNAILPSNVDTPLMREWAATLDDPERLARFVTFVNMPDADPTITKIEVRGQKIPVQVVSA